MHEMSIAEGILDIALSTMKDNDGTVVHRIQLDLGMMSGVEPDALLFCFDALTKNTAAEGASLDIHTIPIEGRCIDCDMVFPVQDYVFKCPHCGGPTINSIRGRELQVTSIDMD